MLVLAELVAFLGCLYLKVTTLEQGLMHLLCNGSLDAATNSKYKDKVALPCGGELVSFTASNNYPKILFVLGLNTSAYIPKNRFLAKQYYRRGYSVYFLEFSSIVTQKPATIQDWIRDLDDAWDVLKHPIIVAQSFGARIVTEWLASSNARPTTVTFINPVLDLSYACQSVVGYYGLDDVFRFNCALLDLNVACDWPWSKWFHQLENFNCIRFHVWYSAGDPFGYPDQLPSSYKSGCSNITCHSFETNLAGIKMHIDSCATDLRYMNN